MIAKKLHLELTNRCVLACPACPRTTWQQITKKPVIKSDLSIDSLWHFLDCESSKQISTLLLCGDYGDCIYYPNLFDFIRRFRHFKIDLHTNGSRRDRNFWEELADLLDQDDEIVFGIDGLESTNHLYRKNADWSSIMLGLDIMTRSKAKVKWQTIVFSFNEQHLTDIKNFALDKGAEFFAMKTHRYGEEHLKPTAGLVEVNHEWQDVFAKNIPIEIEPQCDQAKIVTCDGYFLPCDWIRNPQTFYKSDLWKDKSIWYDKMAIDKINLDQGIELINAWKKLVIEKGRVGSAKLDTLCKMRCRKGCQQSNLVEI